MTRPCVVSFCPGSGGHFIGHICQYIIHGTKFTIKDDGSAHSGMVTSWGEKTLALNSSENSIASEIHAIQTSLPDTESVVVTHSRNLKELSKFFQKSIWISFTHNDVHTISSAYKYKNNYTIFKHNYDNIKDLSWPSYEDFIAGNAPASVVAEVEYRQHVLLYQEWTWIVPDDLEVHNIFKLPYAKIVAPSNDIVYNLCKFVKPSVSNDELDYVTQKWKDYIDKQTSIYK